MAGIYDQKKKMRQVSPPHYGDKVVEPLSLMDFCITLERKSGRVGNAKFFMAKA